MSQSELTARRPEAATAAAKGCEIFLWEQRIDNNCRILLTIDFFHLAHFQGASTRKHPEAREKKHCLAKVMQLLWSSAAGRQRKEFLWRRRSFLSGRACECQSSP